MKRLGPDMREAYWDFADASRGQDVGVNELARRDFPAFVELHRQRQRGEGLPDGHVPYSVYYLVRGGRALFSPAVGMRKPERRFYKLACERLEVRPDRRLFVGDGGSPELSGAPGTGMDAALICPPAEAHVVGDRDETRNWTGERIERISEVLPLAGLSPAGREA